MNMTERQTRVSLCRTEQGKAWQGLLDWLEKKLGTERFRRTFSTITVDNGSEFQDWEGVMRDATGDRARSHICYCHSYSAFERGSNENGNRMIR